MLSASQATSIAETSEFHDTDAVLARLVTACRRLEQLARLGVVPTATQYHRAVSIMHELCEAILECEHAGVPRQQIREAVAVAREIHGASPFVTRLQQWPRGYAGDFETIEWLWSGDNRAPGGTLAHTIEAYALNAAISQQHRNKVSFQASCLLQAFADSRPSRILCLGCGSSPDLRSVARHAPASASIVLCDSDRDALTYSYGKLGGISDRLHLVHGMVPRVLRRVRAHGPFDLILAGGLFDYLPDRLAVRTIAESWRLLAPGGRMVFTNIAVGNPFRVWIEYMGDWTLIERTESDIERLCLAADVAAPAMQREATALAILATITRENDPEGAADHL
jgi:extracellular factor (EF) 3-hydroxypalmitic acid methyl ester biosynthesis protein